MPLDRLLGHEQRLSDLAVGATVGGLAANPPLGRGQRAAPGQLRARTAPRPRVQLDSRPLGQRDGATLVGNLDRLALGSATVAPPSEAAQLGPQVRVRVGKLEPGGAGFEYRDRFFEQRQPLLLLRASARSIAATSPRLRRLRLAEPSKALLAGKAGGLLLLSLRGERRSEDHAPFAGPQQAERLEPLTAPLQVDDRLADPTLGEAQAARATM